MKRVPFAFLLGTALTLPFAVPALHANETGAPALDYAFKFASAIRKDPVDQGKAQEKVVRDYISLNLVNEASRCAGQVQGWRRGVAWAEVAVALAKVGRTNDARQAIEKAEGVKARNRLSWQGPRIDTHIARAHAALGNVETSAKIAAALPVQEAMKAHAGTAIGLVDQGKFEDAIKGLVLAEGSIDFDTNCSLVEGYLAIARSPRLVSESDKRKQAIKGAQRVSDSLPLLKKLEVLHDVADEFRKADDPASAKEVLNHIESALLASTLEPQHKAPALSRMAVAWARTGDKERARRLLKQAAESLPQVDAMDRPATAAAVAAGYAGLQETDEAWRLYGSAIDEAATFANARPRALAIVEVCRSVALVKLDLRPDTRERLDALFKGLKDPW